MLIQLDQRPIRLLLCSLLLFLILLLILILHMSFWPDLNCSFTVVCSILIIPGIVFIVKAFQSLWTLCKIVATSLNAKWASKYGKDSWAIITGCTQGLGKAFCFQLARLGFNLIMISADEMGLQQTNKQLWQLYPNLHVIIIVVDLSQNRHQIYDHIYQKIEGIDVSILVNNVSIGHIKRFHELTVKEISEIIAININCMTYLTQKIIPVMLQRKDRSAIINLSSQSVNYALENVSVYTATKAYNDLFSKCLAQEYHLKIDILSLKPTIDLTSTQFTLNQNACLATNCVRMTLKSLGKCSATSGCLAPIQQEWASIIFGETLTRYFRNKQIKQLEKIKSH